MVILVVGLSIARAGKGEATGTVVGTAIPALVMGIAVSMVLNQLKIAPAIVQITYIALLGSVALGAAWRSDLGVVMSRASC